MLGGGSGTGKELVQAVVAEWFRKVPKGIHKHPRLEFQRWKGENVSNLVTFKITELNKDCESSGTKTNHCAQIKWPSMDDPVSCAAQVFPVVTLLQHMLSGLI